MRVTESIRIDESIDFSRHRKEPFLSKKKFKQSLAILGVPICRGPAKSLTLEVQSQNNLLIKTTILGVVPIFKDKESTAGFSDASFCLVLYNQTLCQIEHQCSMSRRKWS